MISRELQEAADRLSKINVDVLRPSQSIKQEIQPTLDKVQQLIDELRAGI